MGEELEEIIDSDVEEIQKDIEERSVESGKKWKTYVALTCCFLAMFAAISALFAGFKADEELKDEIININRNNRENTVLLKIEMLKSRHEILAYMEKTVPAEEINELRELNEVKNIILEKTTEIREEEEKFSKSHHLLAFAVTVFQLCITLCGLAIIIERKILWHISLVFSICGLYLMFLGFSV